MKSIFNECVERIQHSKQRYRRYVAVLLVLSLCTTLGVNWGLHQNGIAQTTDYQCGISEHQHTEDCYSTELSCGSEEHTHTDDCYDADGNLTCDKTEHTHTDSCYKKETVCGLEEHTHTIECMIDENADVESAADWESTIPTLTGVWADDLVAVAQSQLGYEESTRNFKLADDGETKMGYTRYGAWYENQYGAWSAMFVDFCLKYANITGVPTNSGCNAFMVDVKSADMFKSSDSYQPKAGDIVFLDKDSDGTADSMGIVQSVSGTKLSAIEGDSNDRVEANDYTTDEVLGYAELPENPANEKIDNNTNADEAKSDDAKADDTAADDSAAVDEPTQDDSTADDTIADDTSADEDNTAATDEGPVVSDDEIIGETHTDSSSEQTSLGKKLANAVSALFSSNSGISLASNDATSTGVNMNGYLTNVSFQKKNGVIWQESTEFTTADQVRATMNFENIYTSTIAANNNTIYIDLPAYIDCSRFTGEYDTYDGSTHSGKYTYRKNDDGTYRIVLVLDDDYVEKAGDTIGGNLQFNFQWTEEAVKESGTTKVEIGNWSGDIKITEDTSGKEEESSANYWINKSAGSLYYSEDGKTAYIDYTISLVVKNDMGQSITMKDVLTGRNFTYDTEYGVQAKDANGNKVNANYDTTTGQGTDTKIVLWTGKTGTYTITYRVKTLSGIDASDPDTTLPDRVENKVVVPDEGDNQVNSSTWTNTTTGTIDKQGQLVSGSDATYIDYTVYLNAGGIIKNLKKPAEFTDTLPDNLELQGDVIVKQYDVTGKEIKSEKATVDGQNISYTTPTGQYYYVITYRTMVKMSTLPIGGSTTIKNEGKSTGGIEGSSTAEKTITNHVLHKYFKSQQLKQDGENWYNIMKWSSYIDVKGSLKGYVYEDWSEVNTAGDPWFSAMTMTDEQRAAIVVKDSSGNEVDSNKYTVTTSDHIGSGNVANGLYKITFIGDVQGPVTVEYETTADMSHYTVGAQGIHFINYASLEKDGHKDEANAQTTSFQYRHDFREIIHKYGSNEHYTTDSSGKITLDPGQTSIPWTIQVNEGRNLYTDLIITDTIPENLTYVEGSLTIVEGLDYAKTAETSYDAATKTLTIKIPKDSYSSETGNKHSNAVVITYRTELPKSFFDGNETNKTFSNTAHIEYKGGQADSKFDQEVTRQVVGKSGSYDKNTKILSYNVVINPDGSKLNNGNTLTVTDTLEAGSIADSVSLYSLEVFTALKTTDAEGNVTVKPGKFVQELTPADSGTEKFTYQWKDSDKSFTTYLPDGEAYVIVAKYYVDVDVTADVQIKNTVKIAGNDNWKKEDSSTKVEQDTSGQTWTGHRLKIIKHDASDYNNLLSGAVFDLEKYESGSWTKVESLTTKSDGTVTAGSDKVKSGTLYRLTETSAPEGYLVNKTPSYFIVLQNGATMPTLPDGVSESDVKVYNVTNSEKAQIIIDRYDEKDTTKVNPGELRVSKQWIDSNGNEMSGASLDKMSGVTVTLKKYAPETVTIKFVGNSLSTPFTRTVPKGSTITSSWNNNGTWTVSDESAVKIDTTSGIKFENIAADVTVTNSSMYIVEGTGSDTFGGSLTTDASSASTDKVESTVGSVELNSSNNWTYLWSDLDRSEGVTYTLTEQTVEGYKTTYKLNGSDLTEGTPFTPSTSGDKIVVTNKADQVYKLPESGGIGVTPYTAGGIAVMGTALLCGYSLRRRRERRGK